MKRVLALGNSEDGFEQKRFQISLVQFNSNQINSMTSSICASVTVER
jgi:hypothetical protein